MRKKIFGFLRESQSKVTNLAQTGLDIYLKELFPKIDDWEHNKVLPRNISKELIRPDYRSETLKMVIEFDGIQHYRDYNIILKDNRNTLYYQSLGYKVIRIPYFIQMSKDVVYTLFNLSINEDLFKGKESMKDLWLNTPDYMCTYGIYRMIKEFSLFPDQWNKNKNEISKCFCRPIIEYYIKELNLDIKF